MHSFDSYSSLCVHICLDLLIFVHLRLYIFHIGWYLLIYAVLGATVLGATVLGATVLGATILGETVLGATVLLLFLYLSQRYLQTISALSPDAYLVVSDAI